MKDKRPINLHVTPSRLPITAYVSFLHRVSGIVLYAGIGVLLWLLNASLESEESFSRLQESFANPLWAFVVWATLAALAYHLVAGVRHMIMDFGIGESLRGGRFSAISTLIIAAVLIVLAGVWVW